jgi:hypothetical protein
MLLLVAPQRAAYAHGLFFASTVLSVILTPLAVEVINLIYSGDEHVNLLVVAQVALGTVLLAVLVSEAAVVPYKLWRKRLRAAGPAAAARPQARPSR